MRHHAGMFAEQSRRRKLARRQVEMMCSSHLWCNGQTPLTSPLAFRVEVLQENDNNRNEFAAAINKFNATSCQDDR
jgi:hypothetical protein